MFLELSEILHSNRKGTETPTAWISAAKTLVRSLREQNDDRC